MASMLELSYLVCDPSRIGRSALSTAISKTSRSVTSRVPILAVKGGSSAEKRLTYMKALLASIMVDTLPEETRAGLFLSSFFSEIGDSQPLLETFTKNHNLAHTQIQAKIEHGVAVGICITSQRLIDNLDADIIVGNNSIFENCMELGAADGLTAEALRTVISHIIMIASKCITSPTVCLDNARKRMEAMCTANPAEEERPVQDETAEQTAKTTKQNIIIRRVIVELVEASTAQANNTNAPLAAASHAGNHLRGAGLTGFVMACNLAASAKAPILVKPAYRSEVETPRGPPNVHSTPGPTAPYTKFLGHPKAGLFSPAALPELHAPALDHATAAHATMAGYAIDDAIIARPSYHAGRVFATRGGGAPSQALLDEFNIATEEVRLYDEIIAKHSREQDTEAARPMI